MTQKYAHLMNGFSITVTQVLMNGFSKTDALSGRGPPMERVRIGFQFVTTGEQKNPEKVLNFLQLKK